MKDLPPNVRVISTKLPYHCFDITKNDACGAWNRLCRSFYAAVTRLLGRKYAVALLSPRQRKLKVYDVAVSYLHDAGGRVFYGGCNDFVLCPVEAERKIAFLHCDYRRCDRHAPCHAFQGNVLYALFCQKYFGNEIGGTAQILLFHGGFCGRLCDWRILPREFVAYRKFLCVDSVGSGGLCGGFPFDARL